MKLHWFIAVVVCLEFGSLVPAYGEEVTTTRTSTDEPRLVQNFNDIHEDIEEVVTTTTTDPVIPGLCQQLKENNDGNTKIRNRRHVIRTRSSNPEAEEVDCDCPDPNGFMELVENFNDECSDFSDLDEQSQKFCQVLVEHEHDILEKRNINVEDNARECRCPDEDLLVEIVEDIRADCSEMIEVDEEPAQSLE